MGLKIWKHCKSSLSSYRLKSVKKITFMNGSKLQPLFLHSMMLHFDGDFETYSTFLSHLKLRLGDSNVIFVSHKEWALTKAIQYNFPNSIYLLCLKHLKDNIWKKSERTDKLFKDDREEIVEIIFGSEGLSKSVMIPYSWRPTIKNLNQFSKLKYPQFDILNRG